MPPLLVWQQPHAFNWASLLPLCAHALRPVHTVAFTVRFLVISLLQIKSGVCLPDPSCTPGTCIHFLIIPGKSNFKEGDSFWFMIWGDTFHHGWKGVKHGCEATGHTVSTVGKQAELNAHTQLTFSLVPFFTKSRTPCHEDGAVHILGGSSPPQLKLSGDTS